MYIYIDIQIFPKTKIYNDLHLYKNSSFREIVWENAWYC